MLKRLVSSVVCFSFIFGNLQFAGAQDFNINQLPVPGTMVEVSSPFAPLSLKGLIVNPRKPLEFQFLVDTGRGPQDTASIKEQMNQLVKYFMVGLTIPEGDLWVNLSPYEKNRIVPEALGQTGLGRDLLAQDYILKQLTASLIYPEKQLGKEFWNTVYRKAQEEFGTTNIPVSTFNKVWILPNEAQVFQNGSAVYVTKSSLKVMLDEDYLALQKHHAHQSLSSQNVLVGDPVDTHALASQIVRQIILPEIEKEVNSGKNFAPLRQIYQAMILAKWYKETIQNGLLDALYTNKNKISGVNLDDSLLKEKIYQRYLKAYKKGAFNYIKNDLSPTGQIVPRKYFSGGLDPMPEVLDEKGSAAMISPADGAMYSIFVDLVAASAIGAIVGTITASIGKKKASPPVEAPLKERQEIAEHLINQARERQSVISVQPEVLPTAVSSSVPVVHSPVSDGIIPGAADVFDEWIKANFPTDEAIRRSVERWFMEDNSLGMGGSTSLMQLIFENKVNEAKKLIAQLTTEEINASSENGTTALMIAARWGHEEIVDLLLNKNANVNARTTEGITALMFASIWGKLNIAKSLLKHGADVNAKVMIKGKAYTSYMFASGAGHELIVRLLRDDVNAIDEDGETKLIRAIKNGWKQRITELLNVEGINVNLQDAKGWTALMWAVQSGDFGLVNLLLTPKYHADVHVMAEDGVTSALSIAILNKRPDIQASLRRGVSEIQNGNSLEIEDLFRIIKNGENVEVMRSLLSRPGVDIDMRGSYDHQTLLMVAAIYQRVELVDLLIELGADVNLTDDKGWTALMYAVNRGQKIIVDRLLSNGADVYVKALDDKTTALSLVGPYALIESALRSNINMIVNSGWTPLMINSWYGYERKVDRLLAQSGDVNAKARDRSTALSLASKRQTKAHQRIVAKLKDAGAVNAAMHSEDLGGIDLNKIAIHRTGKVIDVQFDPAQLNELIHDGFEGFRPEIKSITAIQSPLPLMGVVSSKAPSSQLKTL